ncbi:MAG: hypothetical protein ABW202_16830 [Duganella sp.]
MPAAPDMLVQRLWLAVLRLRWPHWLAVLAPLLLAGALLVNARPWLAGAIGVCCLWLTLDAWHWRRRIARQWAAWLDAAVPALEDSSVLLAQQARTPIARLQQQRLQARLATALTAQQVRAVARARVRFGVLSGVLPLLVAVLAAGAAWAYDTHLHGAAPAGTPAPATARAPGAAGDIYLRVTPPAYTGVTPFETAARDIVAPQYSEVRWCVRGQGPATAGAAQALVELSDGAALTVTEACAVRRLNDSLFWRARSTVSQRGEGNTLRYNIRVTPDQAPQVTVVAPLELIHVLPSTTSTASRVQLSVQARDDYAIVRASLHLTLARGSGENVRFSDREVPLPAAADPKVRAWNKQWTLAELGMEPGDELYFFVRATDNAPDNPHTSQSPTYTLRLPGPETEGVESTALPTMVKPESLRSQRQIIIDTEQLVADLKARPALTPATLRARSEAIASDQAALRLRYGQFLGEESSLFGDEHGHAEGANEEHGEHEEHAGAQPGSEVAAMQRFGHVHDQEDNATIFDPQTKALLKRALAAMWDAEKSLRAIAPAAALAPEYKALEAIKELQAAERVYLHRTAFVAPALREDKRMSGDMVGAMSYRRAQGAADEVVPAEIRTLLQSLAQDAALPALWSKTALDAIAARIGDQEKKLEAQRTVQDVQDGCVPCRSQLRAWLRGTVSEAPLLLQARPPSPPSPFVRAWRGKEAAQ